MSLGPLTGAGYLLKGFPLIFQPGIRRYVVVPLAINVLLFSLLIWYGAGRFDRLIARLLPAWLDWLEWLLWPLFALAALIIVFYTFILLANLVGAPFNGLLAEAVERRLTGKTPDGTFHWKALPRDLALTFLSELKKLSYFALRAVPLFILSLIPPLNAAAPLLWMVFSAWMLALEYADYPMGNHGLKFSEIRDRLRKKRTVALGFGAAATVLTLIPVVNFLAMPVAVSGATVLWVHEFADPA